MLKRFIVFSLLFVTVLTAGFSQAITRVAVVDLPHVYTVFFQESRAVREFEEISARVQSDIDRMQREIQTLQSRRADAIAQNNQAEVTRLDAEIFTRQENLRNFFQARTAELQTRRRNLMQSDTFINQVHDGIRFIAESEGYTIVLDKNDSSIVWFSPSVDITERLLQSLRSRNR